MITAYRYQTTITVGVEVELFESLEDCPPSVMVTAHHGNQTLPIPLTADQADQLARELTDTAAELRALQVVER